MERARSAFAWPDDEDVDRMVAGSLPSEQLHLFQAYRELRPATWLDRMGKRADSMVEAFRKPMERLAARAQSVLEQAAAFGGLEDDPLKARIAVLAANCRLSQNNQSGALDAALAGVVAAVIRVTGLTPHPEQVMGALALLDGYIAEMATGEGKTLTASMAAIAAAWRGKPCHVVTANDYLAKRDASLFSRLFGFCGLSVTHVNGETPIPNRSAAYRHDVIYTTAKELLGDYLRDGLALGHSPSPGRFAVRRLKGGGASGGGAVVMRGLHQVIVDEADSVLIDEAVTPLIISMQRPDDSLESAAREAVALARQLHQPEHFEINRGLRHVELTSEGRAHLAGLTSSFSAFWQGQERARELVQQALYAMHLLVRDQHYVVREGKVVLVDELTGRLAEQRTLSLGMQQVLEASQDLEVSPANEVSARLSFQRFFRVFPCIGGMTGTAREAKAELVDVYRLPTLAIPTHKPVQRSELPMRLFWSEREKWDAVIGSARELLDAGRAVLVGVRSVRSSEALFARLKEVCPELAERAQLLHAVNHDLESGIVAQAGRVGALTIATNMAGRGTDIALDEEVRQRGGLHVIIGEPNDLARIDRQLVGRCARQGDPGSVQKFASLEDEVFRRFLPGVVRKGWRRLMERDAGRAENLTRLMLRIAQKRAERLSFKQRQSILEQDTQLDKIGF